MEQSNGKVVDTETAKFNVVSIDEDSKVASADIESQPFPNLQGLKKLNATECVTSGGVVVEGAKMDKLTFTNKDAKEITSGSVLVEEANMDKQQLISFIKEKFEKLQLEREKTPSLEKRNEPTEPSEDCFIEIESFKIMFIIYTEEVKHLKNIREILNKYKAISKYLGFKYIVIENANYKSILQSIRENLHNPKNLSCIAFSILTHEKNTELVELDGLQKICDETSKLCGIPKLFFIEACRGGILEKNTEINRTLADEILNVETTETIISYSTILEPESVASEVFKSTFTEILCQEILKNATEKEFHELLTRVNNGVLREKIELQDKSDKTQSIYQMSSFRTSFPERVFFTKNSLYF